MKSLIVIPARYDSTRFPGKVLADIAGKAMLEWVYDAACYSNAGDVVVATGDDTIMEFCSGRRICFWYTREEHLNGSSRVGEVIRTIDMEYDIVINLQADEPLITPEPLNHMIEFMGTHPNTDIATLYQSMDYRHPDVYSQDVCKVAFTSTGHALYFSRAPISHYKHIGIYAYRPTILRQLLKKPPSGNEIRERLEQLRALEYGYKISCLCAHEELHGVDNPSDRERVADILEARNS